jgi:hypothetical protein
MRLHGLFFVTSLALRGHGQNGQGGQSQHVVFLATAEPLQSGGHSMEQPGGQVGSAQQSMTLATGETGFAAVGVVFAMPTPRTDSKTARAKNALSLRMAALLGQEMRIRTPAIFWRCAPDVNSFSRPMKAGLTDHPWTLLELLEAASTH